MISATTETAMVSATTEMMVSVTMEMVMVSATAEMMVSAIPELVMVSATTEPPKCDRPYMRSAGRLALIRALSQQNRVISAQGWQN